MKRILPVVGILATLGICVAIVALQSRWIGQLSEADLARRKLGLEEALREVRNALNREVSGAYGLLQFEGGTDPRSRAAFTATTYTQWREHARFPDLVRRVLLIQPRGSGQQLEVLAFDPRTGIYAPVDWPAGLEALRKLLALPFRGLNTFGIPTFTGIALGPNPVLVYPLSAANMPDFDDVAAWEVIELDQDALCSRILPQLFREKLKQADQFDLQVVSQAAPEAIVWRSDSSLRFPDPDGSVPLLEVALDYFPHGISGPTRRRQWFARQAISPGPVPARIGEAGVWSLQARHRAGSLDAAATNLRRGNSLISFALAALVALDLAILAVVALRARRLSQSKLEFAATVSHELRTPLAAISSAADNLAAGVAHEPARVQQYGRAILQEARQLTEMVEQILSFASGSAGRTLECDLLEVGPVVEQAIADVTPAARAAGVEIERNIAGELPAVIGDRSAIRQALVNLLNNATKYAARGGWIGVSVHRGESGEIEISVKDRGPGIAADEQRRIFEPFRRGSNAATSPTHGSGLGLTIVDRIARAHRGRVTVESAPGKGSRFTVHLPAA